MIQEGNNMYWWAYLWFIAIIVGIIIDNIWLILSSTIFPLVGTMIDIHKMAKEKQNDKHSNLPY